MPCKKGDVVLVPFPFSDLASSKRRPAVIVQNNPANNHLSTVIIAQVTSNLSRVRSSKSQVFVDISTLNGKRTGLIQNSAVNCQKLATLSKEKIIKTLGRVKGGLLQEVDAALRVSLAL